MHCSSRCPDHIAQEGPAAFITVGCRKTGLDTHAACLRLLSLIFGFDLGDHDPADPAVSPLFADLSGLPPLLIQVGTDEILLDDARRLDARAREAGVEVTLSEWPGMMHDFHFAAMMLAEGRQAYDEMGRFVRSHTHPA